MGSTSKNGSPEVLSRRNTFQRMLDLERKNKLSRMETSSTTSIPLPRASVSLGQSRDSISTPNLEPRPATSLASTGRAMTTPLLSVTIPSSSSSTPTSTKSSSNTTKKYVIRAGGQVVLQDEVVADDDSDVSSICQSPGWDASKKRKKEKREKEKRKKEKEKAEQEALRQAEKAKRKLLKKESPTGKRLSKAPMMARTASESAVMQTLRDATRPPVTDLRLHGEHTRRGSMEISLKHFMQATHAIPVPWKSTQQNSTDSTPTGEEPSTQSRSISKSPSTSSGGFIGGLKLRQAEESTVQETIRVRVTEAKEALVQLHSDDSEPPKAMGNDSSGSSVAESIRPRTPTLEESARTALQWDSIYAQAARLASGEDIPQQIDDAMPIMERNVRKHKHPYPPTSRYFHTDDEELDSRHHRDGSTASGRQSASSNTHSGDGHMHHSSFAAERARLSSPQPEKQGNSYVMAARRQSEDRSLNAWQDELHILEANSSVSSDSQERPTSFFRRSRTNTRERSVESTDIKGSPIKQNVDSITSKAIAPNHSFLSEVHNPPQLPPVAPIMSTSPAHERKSSGLKGIRAAFSRSSMAMDTVKERPPTPKRVAPSVPRPIVTERSATDPGILNMNQQLTKSEQILGEALATSPSTMEPDIAPPPRSSARPKSSGRGSPRPGRAIMTSRERNEEVPPVPTSHSRSRSTASSEERYESCNESSNITTPTASRPHSRKDHVQSVEPPAVTAGGKIPNGFALMSGAVPFGDEGSRRDSWSRTSAPIELSGDEDCERTPTRDRTPAGQKSQADLQKATASSKLDSDLTRKPSISRSISSPDLQDLSFLPALKHQALTRHHKSILSHSTDQTNSKEKPKEIEEKKVKEKETPKGKEKEKTRSFFGKKTKHVSISTETSFDKALVRPPVLPIPTTKSEGSSPTSPVSSQYLEKARLSLPRPPAGPRTPRFPHSNHIPQPGPDPIAKMFVVCCSCKYFHDMPSKIYECMAKPDSLVEDRERRVSGVISTSVKCPWCGHGMSTSCCAGYAAVVYLNERMH